MDNEKALVKTDTQLELARANNMISITSRLLSSAFNGQNWWDSLDDDWQSVLLLNDELQNQQKVSWGDMEKLFAKKLLLYYLLDVSPISPERLIRITKLGRLWCADTIISSLEPIRKFTNLEVLQCNGTLIDSLEPIRNLTAIKDLSCSQTSISSLEPISNLTNIEVLECFSTNIESLEPIGDLINLKELYCAETKINSIEAIMHLPYLAYLEIEKTNISRSEINIFKTLHPRCKIT